MRWSRAATAACSRSAPAALLPGLGRVEAIKRQDGQWVVVTARGVITSAQRAALRYSRRLTVRYASTLECAAANCAPFLIALPGAPERMSNPCQIAPSLAAAHFQHRSLASLAAGACWRHAFPAHRLRRSRAAPAGAQAQTGNDAQNCPGLVATTGRASLRRVPSRRAQRRPGAAHFLGHATFLIESPQLVRIATDYNDYVRPPVLPDIVTMNHAHDTHYTDHPDPAIKHVLRGWGPSPEEPARHGSAIPRRARAQRADQYPQLGAAAPSATAIRSSSSRSPICASPISGICITR